MCPQYASKKAANCCSFPRCISVYFCAVNWNRHQRSCTLPEVSDRVAITMFLAEDPCFLGCVREMYHFIVAFLGQLQRESSTLIKHARQNQTNTNSKSPSRSIGFFAKISRHEYMNTYNYILYISMVRINIKEFKEQIYWVYFWVLHSFGSFEPCRFYSCGRSTFNGPSQNWRSICNLRALPLQACMLAWFQTFI